MHRCIRVRYELKKESYNGRERIIFQSGIKFVIWLVFIHNVFNAAAFPFSGALSNGLRAAGDVKFTMYVSVFSTVAVRLFLSYLLGITLEMGVIGIALAMVCDWIVRAVLFIQRERTGRWKEFQVIKYQLQ